MGRLWKKYGWHALTVFLILVSLVLLVAATLAIGGISWEDARPWVLLGAGLIAAFAALVVQSYAPPGPNFIERALDIDDEPILILLGAALTLVGTVFWFDFGDSNSHPSRWWVVLIGAGMLVLIVGILRLVAPDEDDDLDPSIRAIRMHAARARVAVDEAEKIRNRSREPGIKIHQDSLTTIDRFAVRIEEERAKADEALGEAEGLAGELANCRLRSEEAALGAEVELQMMKRRNEAATAAAYHARPAKTDRQVG